MEKRKLIIILGIVAVLIILPILFFIKTRTEQTRFPVDGKPSLELSNEEKLVSFEDSSGFKFDYPNNLEVRDVTSDDESVYSELEIGSKKKEGKMLIRITDTDYSSLDLWLKSKQASGAGLTREITLSEMPGKQIQFKNQKRLVSIAIADGIMYWIESPLDSNNYWNKIHNDVISSFTLEKAKTVEDQNGQEASDNNSDSISEDEEVIQ